ncbi:hypothetical protein HYV58_01275 [Candidatus Peregrinibacteria bacterium]|nr:hypothetical protein [Candidatus Peregrinibacteria bacterium]
MAEEKNKTSSAKPDDAEKSKTDASSTEGAGETVEGEVVSSETPPIMEAGESLGERFAVLMQELDIGKRQIFLGLGCAALFALLILGGWKGYRYFKNRTPDTPKSPAEVSLSDTGFTSSREIGGPKTVNPEIVGGTGLEAGVAVGTEEPAAGDLAPYISLFRRLENTYNTNIDGLLNAATDRRARLRSYLSLLKSLSDESTAAVDAINKEIDPLRQSYDALLQKQIDTDKSFFQELQLLNAEAAEASLGRFIGISREIVRFRSRIKAFQKVKNYFEAALPKVQARIRDIELNEEPLVAGIKVYDVKGSSLNLILDVTGQEIKEQERLTSPTLGVFPFNPANVTGQNDFITQPGGGMGDKK